MTISINIHVINAVSTLLVNELFHNATGRHDETSMNAHMATFYHVEDRPSTKSSDER